MAAKRHKNAQETGCDSGKRLIQVWLVPSRSGKHVTAEHAEYAELNKKVVSFGVFYCRLASLSDGGQNFIWLPLPSAGYRWLPKTLKEQIAKQANASCVFVSAIFTGCLSIFLIFDTHVSM